jgi:hypothetical protein
VDRTSAASGRSLAHAPAPAAAPGALAPRQDRGDGLAFVTVTETPASDDTSTSTRPGATRRCRWCGRPFVVIAGPGRPKEYCRRSCRQRDYEARRRSADLGLDDAHLVVERAELEALHDRLYELEAAIEDVERDLAASDKPGERDYRDALDWLLAAARPLASSRFGERAG